MATDCSIKLLNMYTFDDLVYSDCLYFMLFQRNQSFVYLHSDQKNKKIVKNYHQLNTIMILLDSAFHRRLKYTTKLAFEPKSCILNVILETLVDWYYRHVSRRYFHLQSVRSETTMLGVLLNSASYACTRQLIVLHIRSRKLKISSEVI